jgi:putative ABC transport system substrate-binding protein
MTRPVFDRPRRVGLLHVVGRNDTSINPVDMADFQKGMRDLGYREGVDVEFRACYGERDLARVRRLADELVAWPADVIVSFLTNANLALMDATRTSRTPIVGWGTDHVAAGTAETNRRPGRNFTGFSYIPFIYGARVRMLKMAVPHARKVAHLYNHTYSPAAPGRQEYAEILGDMGIEMPVYEALRLEDLEPSVAAMRRDGCDAVMVGPHELFNTNGRLLGGLFLEHRLPAFGNQLTIPDYGAVGAMGPPHRNGWPVMAEIPINRSLRGPTVLNLKAAEILGLDLPAKLIDEADVLIETIGPARQDA